MINFKEHIFLTLLDKDMVAELSKKMEEKTYQEGDIIFRENDVADYIYLVLNGVVRITKKDPFGKEQLIVLIKENDYFGEFAVFDGKPRSASAIVAQSETVLARIPGDYIFSNLTESGKYAQSRLTHNIIRKVRENNKRVVDERILKERKMIIGEMASAIIHDIKSPFTCINLAVEMLKEEELSETQKKSCDLIKKQVDRSMEMVNEILDFARGVPKLEKKEIDMADIFSELETLNRSILEKNNIDFILSSSSIIFQADETKILRVLQNLIGNSTEALAGKAGKITIEALKAEDHFTITVSDNGPGIPLEMQSCIFELFSTMGKKTGTGLGMAITKTIIEAHGGTIHFETSPDWGTKFFIKLPLG